MTESLQAARERVAEAIAGPLVEHASAQRLLEALRELQRRAMEAVIASEQRRYLEAQRLAAEHGDRGCFWQYREWDRSLGQLDWLLDEDGA